MNQSTTFTVTWSEAKTFKAGNFNTDYDGVYMIGYRDTGSNERYVIYIGQGAIGTRLADHLRNNGCVKRKIGQAGRVGYYRYAKCTDDNMRLDIELGLYRKYGGSTKLCNDIEPPGSGRYRQIEVNEEFQ